MCNNPRFFFKLLTFIRLGQPAGKRKKKKKKKKKKEKKKKKQKKNEKQNKQEQIKRHPQINPGN